VWGYGDLGQLGQGADQTDAMVGRTGEGARGTGRGGRGAGTRGAGTRGAGTQGAGTRGASRGLGVTEVGLGIRGQC